MPAFFCLFFASCGKKKIESQTDDSTQNIAAEEDSEQRLLPASQFDNINPLIQYIPSNTSFLLASAGHMSLEQKYEKIAPVLAGLMKNASFKSAISQGISLIMKELYAIETDALKKQFFMNRQAYYEKGDLSENALRGDLFILYDYFGLDRTHPNDVLFQVDSDLVWIARSKDPKRTLEAFKKFWHISSGNM